MPSIEGLTGRSHFRRVYASGCRATRGGVTAIVAPRDDGPARLGLSVGKSAGKAVVRNRIRRRLRAAFRSYGPGPADVILVGRGELYEAPFAVVEEYVNKALAAARAPRAAA